VKNDDVADFFSMSIGIDDWEYTDSRNMDILFKHK